jgi:hypothetical protein
MSPTAYPSVARLPCLGRTGIRSATRPWRSGRISCPTRISPSSARARASARGRSLATSVARLMGSRMPKRASAAFGPVAILLMVFVGLGVAQTSPGGRLLHALGISSPSEPYTELALVNPASPGTPAPGATVSFAFWVHNVEGSAHMYTWRATTQAPRRAPIVAASGHLTLANGASDTVALRIPTGCVGSQSRINVSLGGAHQTIGFFVRCPSGSQ